MPGRSYEQWTIGDRVLHEPHRTVTETDNLLISTLTHNPQPLHLDAEYAAASEFGRIVVNGTFTFALMVGLSVADTTLGTLVANLGYNKLVMPKPVFLGDTLRAETEVVELRDSRSRPEAGLVTFAPDDLDWEDEIRVAVEERTSLSPDALTGMEASLRFAGPETLDTKIYGRLTAWQNWIFQRPNAVGPQGALTNYGKPTQPQFDYKRT